MGKHLYGLALATASILQIGRPAYAYDTDAIAESFAIVVLYDQYCSPVSKIVKDKVAINTSYSGVTDAQIAAKLAEVRASINKDGTSSFCEAARVGLIDPLENEAKYGSH